MGHYNHFPQRNECEVSSHDKSLYIIIPDCIDAEVKEMQRLIEILPAMGKSEANANAPCHEPVIFLASKYG